MGFWEILLLIALAPVAIALGFVVVGIAVTLLGFLLNESDQRAKRRRRGF